MESYWRLLREIEALDCTLMALEEDPEADDSVLAAERRRADGLRDEVLELERVIDRAHHPMWGSLLKDGAEVSRFGDQVVSYSDLYTARVSNLARYPRDKYFHSTWEVLPHLQALRP